MWLAAWGGARYLIGFHYVRIDVRPRFLLLHMCIIWGLLAILITSHVKIILKGSAADPGSGVFLAPGYRMDKN